MYLTHFLKNGDQKNLVPVSDNPYHISSFFQLTQAAALYNSSSWKYTLILEVEPFETSEFIFAKNYQFSSYMPIKTLPQIKTLTIVASCPETFQRVVLFVFMESDLIKSHNQHISIFIWIKLEKIFLLEPPSQTVALQNASFFELIHF